MIVEVSVVDGGSLTAMLKVSKFVSMVIHNLKIDCDRYNLLQLDEAAAKRNGMVVCHRPKHCICIGGVAMQERTYVDKHGGHLM